MKQYQISGELFLLLIHYFLMEDSEPGDFEKIASMLNQKLDKIAAREYYSQYKDNDLTSSQREEARKKYLELAGIHKDFRY